MSEVTNLGKNVLVSVCVLAYNHKSYIAQCLDSVLMQETNFPFEIILGEDESTDGTREICMEYANKYSDKIRLFLRSRKDVIYINGRPTGRFNLIQGFKAARGKYIALCDGDDFWDDRNKLQFQYDFLESNPGFVMIGGYAKKIFESEAFLTIHEDKPKISDSDIDTSFLIKHNPFSTLTVFFRNHLIKEFPDIYFTSRGGDRRLYLLLSVLGKIRYFNKAWGVYRIHRGGVSPKPADSFNTKISILLERISNTKAWDKYFAFRFQTESKEVISALEARLFRECVAAVRIDCLIYYFLWLRYRM